MALNNSKSDRRANRTRRSLSGALVELIKEKRFAEITIQNVLDRADVGRSTFYSHFRDKDDLLQRDWEGFLAALARHIDWDKATKGRFFPVVLLFSHLQEFQPFYKGLVRSRKADELFKSGVAYLSKEIEGALALRLRGKAAPQIPVGILANYLASELFNLLQWWLDHGMPYPPERMEEIYHELVTPTFCAALEKSA
jgi:AcrR family transcriptional regulator